MIAHVQATLVVSVSFCCVRSFCSNGSNDGSLGSHSADIDELWKKVSKTCPKLTEDWLDCFLPNTDEEKAKTEITSTLANSDSWKDPNENFLLRLISDDKNREPWVKCKSRVQLALAFVRHMSQDPEFTDFIQSTLDAHGHQEESVKVSDETDPNAGSSNTHFDVGRDDEKRGNGILHEAAKYGQCRYLEKFLSDTNVNARNNIGETALHLAAEFEHSQDVEILLRAGATIQVSLS